MTGKPANVAASVRQRLLNLRRAQGQDYNAILTQYVVERFLYRLSKSAMASKFVLKGAMLFRAWSGQLHRPTRDLDLLGRGESTPAAVAKVVRDVLGTSVPDDGLVFDPQSVTAAEIREEQKYGGIRVKLVAKLGTARIPMQIDVGFGDAITPAAKVQAYPTLLDMDAPRLPMYPPETVVAEKLETAVVRGIVNSRKIVGWSMSERMPAELTCDALKMAIDRRKPDEGLLHHSDRGVQYACDAYQALLDEHEMECSMSRTGNCYDNAMKESFWSTMKREAIGERKFKTRVEARATLFEYIEVFYNRKRRHSSLGYVSPECFEASGN